MKLFLSLIYGLVVSVRNRLFDWGILPARKTGVPVVAVGNVTVGGTGKTPLVDWIVQHYEQQGKSVGYVSRGYKGDAPAGSEVTTGNGIFYGDEAEMIKRKHPKAAVYVGADRVNTIAKMKDNRALDVVVADDAFQHRHLHRDLNIAVIDVTRSYSHYKLLPEGRAREPLNSLQRAHVVAFSRAHLVESGKLNEQIQFFKKYMSDQAIPVVIEHKLMELTRLSDGQAIVIKEYTPLFLLSAIGHPDTFAKMIQSLPNVEIMGEKMFEDHHFFTQNEVKVCLDIADRNKCPYIVITEKDASKIMRLNVDRSRFAVARLTLQLTQGEEQFRAVLDRQLS